MNSIDILASIPILIILTLTSMAMLLELFGVKTTRVVWFAVAYIGSWAASAAAYNVIYVAGDSLAFEGQYFVDRLGFVTNSILLFGALIVTFISQGFNNKQGIKNGLDSDLLISYSVIGAMVMANANNLILLFVGFELLSVCVYVLAALAREQRVSAEAGMKYFILGAFSSAFLLFGMALVYGATGHMEITKFVGAELSPLLISGIMMLLFGFAFKISLVPFHVWAPDVYQGAPTTVTAFMSTVVKTAAIVSFARLLIIGFADQKEFWEVIVSALAALSMVLGNILALNQSSTKRILAFSSIAHAGYASIGLLCGEQGIQATIFYLTVYTFMSLAAFGILLYVTAGTENQYDADDINSFNGLGWSKPVWGMIMLVAVLSLAGIPPLAGFVGKFLLFKAAVTNGYVSLAIIGALSSVVSLYYYLRIVVAMYFRDPSSEATENSEFLSRIGLAFAAVVTVVLGIFPDSLLYIASDILV